MPPQTLPADDFTIGPKGDGAGYGVPGGLTPILHNAKGQYNVPSGAVVELVIINTGQSALCEALSLVYSCASRTCPS